MNPNHTPGEYIGNRKLFITNNVGSTPLIFYQRLQADVVSIIQKKGSFNDDNNKLNIDMFYIKPLGKFHVFLCISVISTILKTVPIRLQL